MAEDWARPVVHWEIEAQDPALLKLFYGALFNWKIGDGFIMEIPPGIGHVVAWPADGRGDLTDRRHWHTACWRARDTRTPRIIRRR
jgi:predicted enzyme related to lactoylglutathione lyase